MILKKVISGGQTGVDRAGLDAAMAVGIAVGGYCPKGRLAEDGKIPELYPLEELEWPQYHIRTEKNVVESEGTLILNKGVLTEGTELTSRFATRHLRPCLIVQLDADDRTEPHMAARWIRGQQITVLNVAGPRESKFKEGIYREAYAYLEKVFQLLIDDGSSHASRNVASEDRSRNTHSMRQFYREEFVKLARQGCEGFAIIDDSLRYVHLNERFAAMNGKPIESHLRASLPQVNQVTASILGPIIRETIQKRTPLLDREVRLADSLFGEERLWSISCHPLQTGNGAFQGAGIVLNDLAVARSENDEQLVKMRKALAEIEELKNRLEAENRHLRDRIEAVQEHSAPIVAADLPETQRTRSSEIQSLEDNERTHIISALDRTGWRVRGKGGAAEILRIKPTTLDAKMKKLGIVRKYLPRYLDR